MKRPLRIYALAFLAVICGMGAICLIIWITIFRFAHPALTETQLFLEIWPEACWAVGFAIAAYVLWGQEQR